MQKAWKNIIKRKIMFTKKIKRTVAMILCLVAVAGTLGGCGAKKEENSGKVSLTVSNWPMEEKNPELFATYEGYLKEMNETNPDIEIIPNDYVYAINTFLPMAASGQLPNMYSVALTEPQKLIDAGYARDITDIVKSKKYDTYISDNILNIVSKDGKIYGIPTVGYAMALSYNMDLMRKAGMVNEDGSPKTPQTYEELAIMAKEIKEKTGQAGFELLTMGTTGGWIFMNIAWSYGVDFMEKVDGKWKATFNTPEAIEAMNYIRDLKWKYDCLPDDLFIDQTKGAKFIATGQAAMGFNDPENWAVAMTKEYKLDLDDLAFSAVPAGPKGRYAQIGGAATLFSKETSDEQVEAALKWMDLVGSGTTFTERSRTNLETKLKANSEAKLPVFNPAFKIWINEERLNAQDAIYDKYVNVNPVLYRNTMEGVTLREEEPIEAQQLYEILSSVMQEVLMNKDADVKTLMDEANAKFQRDFLDNAQ